MTFHSQNPAASKNSIKSLSAYIFNVYMNIKDFLFISRLLSKISYDIYKNTPKSDENLIS